MEVATIRNKALRRLAETGSTKGVIEAERVIDILAFIAAADSFGELAIPPNFGFHALTGHRAGTFAVTVTRNWRMTFTKVDETTVADLDLEDYH